MNPYFIQRYDLSFSIRVFLLMMGLFANGILLANDPILIPFREGKKWGLVSENKKRVVAANYLQIQFQPPYFFCLDSKNSRYDIYSLQGKYIDSCQFFDLIDSRNYILFKSCHEKFTGEVSLSERQLGMLPFISRLQKLELTVTIHSLSNNVSNPMVNGCTNYVSLRFNERFTSAAYFYKAIISHQGKLGLYDMRLQHWILMPAYDSIRFLAPDIIIATSSNNQKYAGDIWGHALADWPAYLQAVYIDKRNGNWISTQRADSMYSGNQKIGSPHDEYIYHMAEQDTVLHLGSEWKFLPDLQEPYAIEVARNDIGKSRTFTIYDLSANRLLDNIYECESVFRNDIFSLKGIDDVQHRTITLGIYNFKKKKYVWKNPDSCYVSMKTDMYLPAIEQNGTITYFNDDGEELNRQDRDKRMFQKDWNLMKKVSVFRDAIQTLNIFSYNNFYALRNDTGMAFSVYNQQLQKVDSIEDIQTLVNDSWHFAYRINKRWGIADGEGRSILAPHYLSIRKEKTYYVLQTDTNRFQRIRCADLQPVPGINKDDLSDYTVNGIWLAVTHSRTSMDHNRRESDSVTIECINVKGEVISSFRREGIYRDYVLTMKGDILEYPADKHAMISAVLLSPQGQTMKTLPYQFLGLQEKNKLQHEPITMRVANHQERTALVSVADFSVIVPFEQDEEAFTQPYTFKNAQGDEMKGVYIMQQGETENKLVGFYSATGVKYWDEKK